jgi:preprotein translocase subunit SecG
MPGFVEPVLWILFVACCVLISVVILLQEGKGGGLGEAFGGVGQQAFGVKAQGIQKFTGWVAFSVIVLSILITLARSSSTVDLPESVPVPAGAPGAQVPDGGVDIPTDGGAPTTPPGDGN